MLHRYKVFELENGLHFFVELDASIFKVEHLWLHFGKNHVGEVQLVCGVLVKRDLELSVRFDFEHFGGFLVDETHHVGLLFDNHYPFSEVVQGHLVAFAHDLGFNVEVADYLDE